MENPRVHQAPEPQTNTVKKVLKDEVKHSKEDGSMEKIKGHKKDKNRTTTSKKGLDSEERILWSKYKRRCPSCIKINGDKTKYGDAGALWTHYKNETYHACLKKVDQES